MTLFTVADRTRSFEGLSISELSHLLEHLRADLAQFRKFIESLKNQLSFQITNGNIRRGSTEEATKLFEIEKNEATIPIKVAHIAEGEALLSQLGDVALPDETMIMQDPVIAVVNKQEANILNAIEASTESIEQFEIARPAVCIGFEERGFCSSAPLTEAERAGEFQQLPQFEKQAPQAQPSGGMGALVLLALAAFAL